MIIPALRTFHVRSKLQHSQEIIVPIKTGWGESMNLPLLISTLWERNFVPELPFSLAVPFMKTNPELVKEIHDKGQIIATSLDIYATPESVKEAFDLGFNILIFSPLMLPGSLDLAAFIQECRQANVFAGIVTDPDRIMYYSETMEPDGYVLPTMPPDAVKRSLEKHHDYGGSARIVIGNVERSENLALMQRAIWTSNFQPILRSSLPIADSKISPMASFRVLDKFEQSFKPWLGDRVYSH